MQINVRMLIIGILGMALVFAVQGCARKQISSSAAGTATGTGTQIGDSTAGGTQMNASASGDSQMTPEQMEEFRLQEKKRQEAAQAEAAKKKKARQEAVSTLRDRIHFAFDSYELRVDARQALKKKAKILDKYPNIDMVIEGHCDERGTDEYNLALGERRARAAYEFLVLLGIDPDRLSMISYGEERPLDPGHNEEAWAKNRRCEFRVTQ